MKNLIVYARPVQLLVLQVIEEDKILINENCEYKDLTSSIAKILEKTTIEKIILIGTTVYADGIYKILSDNFNNIQIERESFDA